LRHAFVDASAALIGSLPEVATSAVSASARGIVGVTHQERGLPAMGSGPENPAEFAYRNVLIFTFFCRADSLVPKIVDYRTPLPVVSTMEMGANMASKLKRAVLYLRVSTDGQTVDNQRLALEAVCEQRGWEVVEVYADKGVSGAKGRNQRPGLDALLKDAARGRFNVVLAWALDRLGRSLMDLLDTLSELDAVSVALVLHQQAIDTTTPAGRMFFQVTGAFAEFERGMIRSRVMAGLERARSRGVCLGRPRTGAKVEAAIRARLTRGEGIKKVAKAIGVGNGTVSRIKAAMR
jgi:DNA invertase Pin-like site-specific DNA recombinase